MFLCLTTLLVFICDYCEGSDQDMSAMAKVIRKNGFHGLLMTGLTGTSVHRRTKLVKLFMKEMIYVGLWSKDPVTTKLLIFVDDPKDLSEHFELLAGRKVETTIVYIDYKTTDRILEELMTPFQRNSMFVVASPTTTGLQWKEVITLNKESKAVVNRVEIRRNLKFKMENSLLGKWTLKSINMDWEPFVALNNCNKLDYCDSHGLVPDLIDLSARLINFSRIEVQDISKDWGLSSISTGNLTGLVGKVIDGTFPVCFNSWALTADRSMVLDYSLFLRERTMLLIVPTKQSFAYDFLFKPFVLEARLMTFAVACVTCALAFTIKRFLWDYEDRTSYRIVLLTGGLFFVMTNTYLSAGKFTDVHLKLYIDKVFPTFLTNPFPQF